MEFCISRKAAKFFVQVTTIVFLVRVESLMYRGPQDLNTILRTSRPKAYSPNDSQRAPSINLKSFSVSSPNIPEPAAQETLPASSEKITRKPLVPDSEWISDDSRQVTNLLSPSTLSHPDLFQHLLREMSKVVYTWKLASLGIELDSRLKSNLIPESVMPYARALKSIIGAEINLDLAKRALKEIRNNRSYIPPEVSSPPALSSYGLFSSDIIADPDILLRLVDKLMQIPKSEIPNLIIQLQDYLKIWDNWGYGGKALRPYNWYAQNLLSFLGNDSRLEDLKRSKAEIQRLSDSNQNSTIDGKMNEETASSAT